MTLLTLKELLEELEDTDYELPANCTSREEYGEWLREKIKKDCEEEMQFAKEESLAREWNNGHWDDSGD